MVHEFDPGYVRDPFAELVAGYPGDDVYPAEDFRVEWGPIFHRGRLDGSARVLVLGQDPGAHEAIVRRILVGEAGQRVQGFLAKLGIDRSYVMINAFLYSVYGQGGGERHRNDPAIAAYRNGWLDALLVDTEVEAVVAIGGLADAAFQTWLQTPAGAGVTLAYRRILHPTYPESASAHGQATKAEAMGRMLAEWNEALEALRPHVRPDFEPEPGLYGETLDKGNDLAPIPETDLPAGLPAWMRSLESWAVRRAARPEHANDPAQKRATIVVTVPGRHRPWAV